VHQKAIRLEQKLARLKSLERKEDTRRKIQLGGLIKKAGLDNEANAVLYGLLLDAAELLHRDDGQRYRDDWRIKGDLAFSKEQKEQAEQTVQATKIDKKNKSAQKA